MIDLRLAIPAVCAWAAAAVFIGFPDALPLAVLATWGLSALALAGCTWTALADGRGEIGRKTIARHGPHPSRPVRRARARRGRPVRRPVRRPLAAHPGRRIGRGVLPLLAVTCAVTGLVLGSASLAEESRRPPSLVEAAGAGRFVTAEATTTQSVLAHTGSYTVTISAVEIGRQHLVVSVPARIFGAPPGREWGIGTVIEVRGTLAATEAADSVAFIVFPTERPSRLRDPPPLLDWANELRSGFRRVATSLPGDGGDLLPGLAIGDTSAVSTTLDTSMKSTSLSHLTAVSGANCAVVIGLILLAGGTVGVPRAMRIGAAVAVLVGFVVLVTPEPSVLRAAVMATLTLAALASGRPARGVPVLALAIIALLATDPWLARGYGFVLSVLATAGLLVLAGPLTVRLSRWLPRAIAATVAIPLAAQLACQSVIVLLNPTLPTYGVIANMLAEPAAPVATVLGLIACVVVPVAPQVAGVIAGLAWVPAAWIAAVARFFTGLPGANLPWPGGAPGVAALAVVTVLAVVLVLARSARSRRVAASALALSVAVGFGLWSGHAVRAAATRPADWEFAQCDVGQGDAVVVRSAGRIALIDTGRDEPPVAACLRELGVTRIDLLVLTHYDLDHVGGTPAVVGMVDRALVGPSGGADDDRLDARLRSGGAEVVQASRGLSGRLGDLDWTVLWPPDPLRGVAPGNPASVTLRFDAAPDTGAALSGIFLGDLGQESQAALLAADRRSAGVGTSGTGKVDVVKVAHHGSADQEPRLYESLEATVGLIGVGADNTYGHPTSSLLGILRSDSTVPERSDLEGLVLLAPDTRPGAAAGGVLVWSER
ncbi:MAG: ComEC/Rec2 family competence protein [Burkholderiaceae bacterium]|nr:ComEC/Rec2 family competence protein [Microbacteriaceae bacterium]